MARVTSATDEKHRVHKRGVRELRLAVQRRIGVVMWGREDSVLHQEDSICKGSVAGKSTALSGPARRSG